MELVRTEFPELHEYEQGIDTKQLRWVREQKWIEGPYREAPEGLAFHDLLDFDVKVRNLAEAQAAQHKITISDCVSIPVGGGAAGAEEEPIDLTDDLPQPQPT